MERHERLLFVLPIFENVDSMRELSAAFPFGPGMHFGTSGRDERALCLLFVTSHLAGYLLDNFLVFSFSSLVWSLPSLATL